MKAKMIWRKIKSVFSDGINTIVGGIFAAAALAWISKIAGFGIAQKIQCFFSVKVDLWIVLLLVATSVLLAIFIVRKRMNTAKPPLDKVRPTTLIPPLVYVEVINAKTPARLEALAVDVARAANAYNTRIEGNFILAFTDTDVDDKVMKQLKNRTTYADFRYLLVSKGGGINNSGFNMEWVKSVTKEEFLVYMIDIPKLEDMPDSERKIMLSHTYEILHRLP